MPENEGAITPLHLLASFPDGSRLAHPIQDEASMLKVYGWLSPLCSPSAEWSVTAEPKG